MDALKECNRCRQFLAHTDFNRRTASPDGLQHKCRPCDKVMNKHYKHLNPVRVRDARLRYMFNISLADRDEMLLAQGNACAICGIADSGARDWHTDHDSKCCPIKGRSCGKCVRGILCSKCNTGLGLFTDSVSTLRSAIAYLERAS